MFADVANVVIAKVWGFSMMELVVDSVLEPSFPGKIVVSRIEFLPRMDVLLVLGILAAICVDVV